MINSLNVVHHSNYPLNFSKLELKQQAKSLKTILELDPNFPKNIETISIVESKDILSKTLGFQNWKQLFNYLEKEQNNQDVIAYINYIGDFFVYLSNNFKQLCQLDEQLFKNKNIFPGELLVCANQVKNISLAINQKKLDEKTIIIVGNIVKKFYYCYIATKGAFEYNHYINTLYETEFIERFEQLNLSEGINNLGIKELQFLMTYELKMNCSLHHVYVLQIARELIAGNYSVILLKKFICMLAL